ncbi:MAG: double-strand break repair protein AddB, partial [Alphaproteobacteria bacterium]|nr:double-strand break repair protein AddB [Alphaproteobacteria bacterium]
IDRKEAEKPDRLLPRGAEIKALLEQIAAFFGPLTRLYGASGSVSFAALLDAHLSVAHALCPDGTLWQGDAGEALALFLDSLRDTSAAMPDIRPTEYLSVLEWFLSTQSVRPAYGTHPRLAILGQLEARLLQSDLVILGGLNDGVWPASAATDPWMSRPMRQEAGLPSPERSVGLAAHDFVQGFCASQVVLTRSRRTDGAPTVPSRWLQRLETVLTAFGVDPDCLAAHPYLSLSRALDRPEHACPQSRPAPRPPLEKRPRTLPVTAIETWRRDPYSLYARYVLKLRKLDPLEMDADAALRGTLVHEVLDRFIRTHGDSLPSDPRGVLTAMGRESLSAYDDAPALLTFWEPRLNRLLDWFAGQEQQWRGAGASPVATELSGRMTIADGLPGGAFTLTAKADRIDRLADGRMAIIDYKTGAAPAMKDVHAGFSPQMPLEGALLAAGGFPGCLSRAVGYLGFWILTGGAVPGKEKPINTDSYDLYVQDAYRGLLDLVTAFDDPETPYYSLPRPDKAPPAAWQDYSHLARVQEWVALEDDPGEAA